MDVSDVHRSADMRWAANSGLQPVVICLHGFVALSDEPLRFSNATFLISLQRGFLRIFVSFSVVFALGSHIPSRLSEFRSLAVAQ